MVSLFVPYIYSVVNLSIAILDSVFFWSWWRFPVDNQFAWIVFIPKFVHVIVAVILYIAVKQRNALQCKLFCYSELVLLCLEMLILINISFSPYTYVIWMLIYIGLRVYCIVIIGGLILAIQSESGGSITFPWSIFPKSNQTLRTSSNPASGLKTMPI